MTNPLIPNTFVPGTKAKAQEVNSNFIALAEEIQGTQSNVKEQFSQLRADIDDKMDYIAQNYAQKDLVNTGTITNTILEAPNGIVNCDGQTITVQNKIKILIPNGKLSNGKLANLEYETAQNTSKVVTNLSDIDTVVFLDNSGNIDVVEQNYIFYKNSTPTTLANNAHWYNIDENKWYKYLETESRWVEIFEIPIANITWDENSTISFYKILQPLNTVKTSDLNNFYTLKGVLPLDMDYIVERYTNDWETYTVYKSGWVQQTGFIDGKGDIIANFFIPMKVPYIINLTRITTSSNGTDVGIWARGEFESTYMKVYSSTSTGKVWSVEGFKLNLEEV